MRSNTSNRRQFFARTAVVSCTIGLAGCLSGGSKRNDGRDSQTTTPNEESETSTTENTDSTNETRTETSSSPETSDSTTESVRTVSFEAPHGATIEATSYGSGDCGVVLVPQINMDKESWQPQAEMIADMGHLALAIDEDPDNRSESVRGAVRYLDEQRGVSTRILVGASTGGEAIVAANAKTDVTVDGTITLSAAGGADHASELHGRSLFVVSEGDDDRFVRLARELHQGAPEPKQLIEYDGSAHGQRIFDSEYGTELRDQIRTFVSRICGP
ncbi:hypothetical protein SAMN04489841_3885 [Natrinema salaciae]|uniref:Alpha/beta hydrolase family protein n=1 Tax=Natrinema salaciae TaxID=1186196 RepID=A0A1H9P7F6_9EURY|nr:hypothetical protein SAMN04489841_3885 [Natrinema salaciae]